MVALGSAKDGGVYIFYTQYRDEPACVGVQHETNVEHRGHETANRGDQGIKGPFLSNKTGKTGS